MPIYQLDGITPVIHPSSFVHPSADIIGDVIIGKNVYIGPQVSVRGDMGGIRIMDGSNIQDNSVIHGFPAYETVLEENSHIGHGAIIHGCHIEENCLIGMNAVVMDLSVIGKESIVGAHSFIKAHSHFDARSLILGSPATVKRKVLDDDLTWKMKGTEMYHELVKRCKSSLIETAPLPYPEKDREGIVFTKTHSVKK